MYHQSVILDKLTEFERKNKWALEYHSLGWVEEFKAYIDKISKMESNTRSSTIDLKVRLTKAKADWIRKMIQNEQALCTIDADYFESRYAYITDNSSEIYKFQNRKSQEVFDSIIAQFDLDEVAIELLILKARQLGVSTKVALKFLHRLLFLAHTQALMSSVNTEKSELLGRMIQVCLEHLPWWLFPRRTRDSLKAMEFANGSFLSIQSGSQATGLAQGWTPTLVHISEIGDIPFPKKVLEEGLFKATHPTRKLFAVYEGTGNGNTGWQADKWRATKEDWPRGSARLCPIFLNWPCAPDQYPEPDWLRKFPIPGGWQPHAITRKHILKCELYIRNTPYMAKVMGKNWRMPIEQQWYWEFNYDEHVKTHTQKIWLGQMPADDFEALQGKNDIIFNEEVITALNDTRKLEYQDYAITGDSVDDGFEPSEEMIDYKKERIVVNWQSHRGQRYEWIMIPLLPLPEDAKEEDTLGRVRVFEEPRPKQDYTFGIDTADGLGNVDEDRSVCSGTRKMVGDECDEQVFEFIHNRVNSPQMVSFAACLAAWYSQGPRGSTLWTKDPRGVKFCIEQRERPGDDCQLQLKLMGFNYHQNASIQFDAKHLSETKGHIQGFRTNNTTRPILTGRFVDAINNGWYKPHSKWLIEEAKTWERKTMASGKSRMDHQAGKHDDRILAAALSYFAGHTFEILAERMTKRYALPSSKNPEVDYKDTFSTQVSVGVW
jgi:hypothetical protein